MCRRVSTEYRDENGRIYAEVGIMEPEIQADLDEILKDVDVVANSPATQQQLNEIIDNYVAKRKNPTWFRQLIKWLTQ